MPAALVTGVQRFSPPGNPGDSTPGSRFPGSVDPDGAGLNGAGGEGGAAHGLALALTRSFSGSGKETIKPPVPKSHPSRTGLPDPGHAFALPAPGVMPVTGERSQLVVGKCILQVAVVSVVEHGLDPLPGED